MNDQNLMAKFDGEVLDELRDIHAYHALEIPIWLWWTLGIIASGFLAYFIYKKIIARKPATELSNYERILQALGDLKLTMPSKEFYLKYSELVRYYFQEEFGIPLMDKTAEEIKPILSREPLISTSELLIVTRAFSRGDLAKFAKKEIPPLEKEEDVKLAKSLIGEVNERLEAQRKEEELREEQGLDPEDDIDLLKVGGAQ